MSNKVKAEKYTLQVSDGVLAAVHGMTSAIEEIAIPSREIAFNIAGDKLQVFRGSTRGGVCEDIEVSKELVDALVTIVEMREKCLKEVRELFDDEGSTG